MSAFVVNEEHVKQLALAWGQWDRWNRRTPEAMTETAQELMRENLRSVRYRYPDSDELPGPIQTPEADTIVVRGLCKITPVMALKMADCLEYQSCETPDWKETAACKLLNAIRHLAINRLPGFEDAPWEYRPEDIARKEQEAREAAKARITGR